MGRKLSLFSLLFLFALTFGCSGNQGSGAAALTGADGTSQTVSDTSDTGTEVAAPVVGETEYVSGSAGTSTSGTSSADGSSEATSQSATDSSGETAASEASATDSSASSSEGTTSATVAENSQPAVGDSSDDEVESPEENADAQDSQANDSLFNFATLNIIPASLTFNYADKEKGKDVMKPVSMVEVSVYDADSGTLVTSAYSAENGTAAFEIPASLSSERLEIVIKKDGFTPKEGYFITVPENSASSSAAQLSSLASIVRSITLSKVSSDAVAADRDKDGVSDSMDDFPDNAAVAKAVKYSYTLAFEDKYPKEGFADFNDAVIKLDLDELLDSGGSVSGVTVRSQVLAAGSAKSNSFSININGTDYLLIDDIKKQLGERWNTRQKDSYVPGKVNVTEIKFRTAVSRSVLGAAPYDPFITVNGARKGHKKNEIHLSFVKTNYKKQRLGSNGVPFALLLPDGWIWPSEKKAAMFFAYPDFEKWYKSAGKKYSGWYNSVDRDYIFSQASSESFIAGYLFGSAKMKTLTILAMLAIVAFAIAAVRYIAFKRR